MVNSEDFIKRLEFILDYYSLSASGFADKIGVQRSSLSHLLSGRNKPSLDFILKIIQFFPEIDLYWILNGQGTFPKNGVEKKIESTDSNLEKKNYEGLFLNPSKPEINNPEELKKIVPQEINSSAINYDDQIEKIIVFYSNGTFRTYKPQ